MKSGEKTPDGKNIIYQLDELGEVIDSFLLGVWIK